MNINTESHKTDSNEEMRFTLRNDYAFKKVFGSTTNKNPLIELLSLIFEISKEEIEDIMIENPYLENEYYDEKKAVLDLKLTLKDGKKINVEMQNYWQPYFIPRVLYYWSKRYIGDFKESQQYDALAPCISINILNEKFKYSNHIHSVYELLERKTHTGIENYLEIHFLDLTKLEKRNLSLLEKWLLFIKTDEQEVRDMLSVENLAMKEANTVMRNFYINSNDRFQYEAAERLQAEKKSLFAAGMNKGYEQKTLEIAKAMKLNGLLDEQIMRCTGLNKEEVEKL